MNDFIHVHPQEVVRFGLKHMLRGTDLRVVASIPNAADAEVAMDEYPGAILLTDVMFGGHLELSPLMKAKAKGRLSVAFSMSEDPGHVLCAREENALDYIFFSASREDLIGRLTRAATERTQGGQFRSMRQLAAVELTLREKQVMRHLVLGLTNKEIGQALELSIETVKEHVQHILRKLGVNDRTQAAVRWVRMEGSTS